MDDFETMFPKSRPKFGINAIAVDRWIAEMEEGNQVVAGGYILLSDDLLKRCFGWYEHRNIFQNPSFSILYSRFREANAAMAKRGFSRTPQIEKAAFNGFIEYRLSDEQLEALDMWEITAMDMFSYCDNLTTKGIKLSLSYNPNTKLATCSLMDERKKLENGDANPAAGRMLSTSDTTCALALKAAVYKHFHALEENWAPLIAAPSQGGRRG